MHKWYCLVFGFYSGTWFYIHGYAVCVYVGTTCCACCIVCPWSLVLLARTLLRLAKRGGKSKGMQHHANCNLQDRFDRSDKCQATEK